MTDSLNSQTAFKTALSYALCFRRIDPEQFELFVTILQVHYHRYTAPILFPASFVFAYSNIQQADCPPFYWPSVPSFLNGAEAACPGLGIQLETPAG